MRILVCINNPDEGDTDTAIGGELQNEDPSILNTDNENALEAALKIKDILEDTHITAMAAGPKNMEDMLRECIAKGADEAIFITDEKFDFTDPWTLAEVIAGGINRLEQFDLILMGNHSFDLDIIQITPQLSEKLNLPLISQISEIDIIHESARVKSELENCTVELEVDLPCILSVIKEINTPRYTTIQNMMMSLSADLIIWNSKDIKIAESPGMDQSGIETLLSFPLKPRGSGIIIEGETSSDIAEKLMNQLRKKAVL